MCFLACFMHFNVATEDMHLVSTISVRGLTANIIMTCQLVKFNCFRLCPYIFFFTAIEFVPRNCFANCV